MRLVAGCFPSARRLLIILFPIAGRDPPTMQDTRSSFSQCGSFYSGRILNIGIWGYGCCRSCSLPLLTSFFAESTADTTAQGVCFSHAGCNGHHDKTIRAAEHSDPVPSPESDFLFSMERPWVDICTVLPVLLQSRCWFRCQIEFQPMRFILCRSSSESWNLGVCRSCVKVRCLTKHDGSSLLAPVPAVRSRSQFKFQPMRCHS